MSLSTSVNNRGSPRASKNLPVDRAKPGSKVNTASSDQLKLRRTNKSAIGAKAKHPDARYDTLDSAYSTSESSYNTVDSSYSQQSSSSGYDTLESRCKVANHSFLDRRWNNDDTSRLKPPTAASFDVGATTGVAVADNIRFVDDINESDTATETETDTEHTASANSIDMSYVPDYIRPVALLPPHLNNQPIHIASPLSASLSSSSSTSTLTASSSKDDSSEMPRKNYRRTERNSPHSGYREDYMRKQKEKLCGRKSLGDRLRSLESGAAVKLQVCKGSQNRRRKSVDKEALFSQRSSNNEVLIPIARSKSPIADDEIEDSVKQDLQMEATPTRAPPPDIIESHQPPNNMSIRIVTRDSPRDYNLASNTINGSVEVVDPPHQKLDTKTSSISKEISPERLVQTENSPVLSRNNSFPPIEMVTDSRATQPSTSRSCTSDNAVPLSTDQPQPSDVKITKLKWREPSQEALNKLHASQLASKRHQVLVPSAAPEVENNINEKVQTTTKNAGGLPPQLIVDVTTENRVVPVELRSPRHDGGNRSNMKGKRKARVFVFPSSDDSECDNFMKKQEDSSRLDHVAPVKFVPSVLRRSAGKTPQKDVIAAANPSQVANVKANSANDSQNDLTNKHDSRSQSLGPKRPSTKRSKSSHDRSAVDRTRHSRTLSSGDQSPTVCSARSSSRHKEKSPERESSRSRSDRKSNRTPSRGRKSKTEYAELSDVKRSSSHRSKKYSPSTLPSPRQQAVAHAVKFGVTGNEGEFPYIDDTTAITEERTKPPPADPRDRSKSDGALLHDADTATVRRAFPLSRRGRSSKRKEGPRRISYMEAMESSEDLTPDPESDTANYGELRAASSKEVPLGTYGRSNSADSVLSTTEIPAKVVLRKHARANSADRGSLKKAHRRSYQIATNKPVESVANRYSPHKRQPSIRRLKNFFENNQQSPESQATEGRRGSRGRSLDPLPTLVLNECDGNVAREGFLYFKVATIEKGKRTSSQKSWKLVWVVLKDQSLFLCKDWSRNKAESISNENGPPVHLTPPSGGHTPSSPPTQLVLEEEEPLNIKGSLVSIAYNYLKRKNVIRLTTGNGSEYLFQAEDGDDMLAWISSIQTRGCHDDEGGEAAINKDLILKKSSQIESGTVSFVGIKKTRTEPCILCSIRPIDDPQKSPLPRTQSDLSHRKFTVCSSDSSDSDSPGPRISPPPFYGSSHALPKEMHSTRFRHASSLDKDLNVLPVATYDSEDGLSASPQSEDLNPIPVVRRSKSNAIQKRIRRRGIVWTDDGSKKDDVISNPVLISHPSLRSGSQPQSRLQPRSVEEQQDLLRKLAEAQMKNSPSKYAGDNNNNQKPKQAKKSFTLERLKDGNSRPRPPISGGKMAGRIQRTIRALYEGNRRSFERLDEEDPRSSDDETLYSPSANLANNSFLSSLGRSSIFTSKAKLSPKPEKRATRKSRSPKPPRRPGVQIKDVDGSRRFKWRGSVNRIVKKFGQGQTLMPGGTFDVHLEDCPLSPNNEMVPFVVELCCRIVEEHGLSFTGIYRVPGNSGTLSALQEELNIRGAEAVDLDNDTRLGELNVVSSLLKSFFRKLPDPLFTNELYEDFITMNRKKDSEERLNGLRRLIHMLPAPHYETLKYLITHLRKVADHSEINKMEIRNLAIVFGPTLVRSTISDNMATMVTDMSDQCRIVESVLQHTAWFFSDEEVQGPGVQIQPVPKEEDHEPVPNIDHLLANVGRTPGDNSDTTSESSKSKASNTSDKDSFSRDVLEIIFGAGKRLLNQHSQRPGKEDGTEESSGDEYGFKEVEKKPPRASIEPPKSPTTKPSTSAPQKYQVAKPVASGIRANWHNKSRSMHPDITSSLYDYYVDNWDRTPRSDVTRHPQYMTSSSTDSSPHVTPRGSSLFVPSVQRTYAMQTRHSADSKPHIRERQWAPPPPNLNHQHQTSSQKSIPRLFISSEDVRQPSSARDVPTADRYPHEDQDIEENSDSDSSIYVGDTLEEKLKNLTNLEKKLERRPSRRHANRRDVAIKMPAATDQSHSKAANKKLSAPSKLAGERITPDNLHMYSGKKTTRELYRERKAQRQHQRELVRVRRNEASSEGINRCISDENVFKRSDPKRQVMRSNASDDANRQKRTSTSGEKVRRRHTLGGGDFPGQDFWQHTQYASLQNVSNEDPSSAMARLRPQIGTSSPLLRNLSNSRLHHPAAAFANKRPEKHKTESYL